MASEKDSNLISFAERTTDEAREIGSKGGRKSGASRRRKRAMREAIETLLSAKAKDADAIELLKDYGFDESEMTNLFVLIVAMFEKAIDGDVRAAEFLRDTAGENPAMMIREKELSLKRQEFEYRQQQDRREAEAADSETASFIETVERAWQERQKNAAAKITDQSAPTEDTKT